VKLGVCNEMFEGWPIGKVFGFAAELGYDGVEIAPFTLAERASDVSVAQRTDIARQARNAGVEIVGLHWLLVSPKDLYINHPDDAIRLKTRDYLLELIDLCGDLGGKTMVLGSPKQRSIVEGQTYDATWTRTVDAFRSCLDRAARRSVTLCLEQLTPKETNFITTVAEAAKMVDEINHPNFRLILDVKAMLSLDWPVPDTIRLYGSKAAHVHANEADGNGPGTGPTDFAPIFQALDDVAFRGCVSVEVFDFKPGPEKIARDSLAYLKKSRQRSERKP